MLQEKTADFICVTLLSGKEIKLPLRHILLKKWSGKKPAFSLGNKPFVEHKGKPLFAELAILDLFIDSGWNGVWVSAYGGTHFLNTLPKSLALSRNSIAIPPDRLALLEKIWLAGATSGCFDNFLWKEGDVLFCESKHKNKDALTKPQIKFIEGALACGVTPESLIIMEWEYEN